MSSLAAYMGESVPKRKVFLHGYLGEMFGEEFELAVRSPVEAIRILEANFPRKFSEAVKKGVFRIVVTGHRIAMQCSLEMCHFLFPQGSIHIVPIPEGAVGGSGGGSSSTKGIVLSILGVALIATAFVGAAFLSGAASIGAGLGTAAIGGVTWGQIGLLGAALLLLGVAILLTPTPKTDSKPDTYQSFFYSGAVNSDREGSCVPIVYGRCWAGSVVIAGGIFDAKYATTTNTVVLSSYGTYDNEGQWIPEQVSDGINDDPNKLHLIATVADQSDVPTYTVAYPARPVGGLNN